MAALQQIDSKFLPSPTILADRMLWCAPLCVTANWCWNFFWPGGAQTQAISIKDIDEQNMFLTNKLRTFKTTDPIVWKILHWDGMQWQTVHESAMQLDALFVLDKTHVFVSGKEHILLYDGKKWNSVYQDKNVRLPSMFALSPTDIWVAAREEDCDRLLHQKDNVWNEVLTPSGEKCWSKINQIWAETEKDVWLAGDALYHLQSTHFSEVKLPFS